MGSWICGGWGVGACGGGGGVCCGCGWVSVVGVDGGGGAEGVMLASGRNIKDRGIACAGARKLRHNFLTGICSLPVP